MIGNATQMRASLKHAIHPTRHRQAVGRYLAEQPLMRNVLADLALKSEFATPLFMRLARAFEQDGASLFDTGRREAGTD